ncbi:uncharacterized protein JCM10292_006987 [Rhodotorula paludigena]|uniref:uncharacterized protein n=1 Tax=Rhodotorula paludigena TaxID=86838 RepID=UPI0031741625
MVSFLSRRKDTLTVSFLEDVLYLHPPAKRSPQTPEELAALEPSHDPILRGQVTLSCAAARKARRISVELVGRATRHSGDGSHSYESSVSLEKHLEIDLHNERLEQGVHTWDFCFIIPSSTAVGERSTFGTVRHTVRAILHGAGSFRDLSSMPRPIFLIANPAAPGDLPTGLEIDVRHPACELGPIALHVSSPHLTVAGLIFLSVSFEAPPEGMKIMSVQAFVRQEFEIHYSPPIPVSRPPVQKKLLFYVDSSTPLAHSTDDLLDRDHVSRGVPPPMAYEPRALKPQPLAVTEGGKEWLYARVARIPDDDSVRPTTLDGTDTPIRVKHQLVCQVRYRFAGSKKDHVLEMASPVTIASCGCINSSLLLPVYRKQYHPSSHIGGRNGHSVPATPADRSRSASPAPQSALSALSAGAPIGFDSPGGLITPFHRRCLCNTPLQKLVDQEGEKLVGLASDGSEGAASRSRSRSRILPRQRSWLMRREGSSGSNSDVGDEAARGRERARKPGETYPVQGEEVGLHGIEELGPIRGAPGTSWAGMGEALRPAAARRADQVRSEVGPVTGGATGAVDPAPRREVRIAV